MGTFVKASRCRLFVFCCHFFTLGVLDSAAKKVKKRNAFLFGVGSDDDDDDDLDTMTSELAVTKSLGGNTAAVLKKSREPGASSLFDSDDEDASDADEFSKEVGCLVAWLLAPLLPVIRPKQGTRVVHFSASIFELDVCHTRQDRGCGRRSR